MSRPQLFVPQQGQSGPSNLLPSGWQSVPQGPPGPFDQFSGPPGFRPPAGGAGMQQQPPGFGFGPPPGPPSGIGGGGGGGGFGFGGPAPGGGPMGPPGMMGGPGGGGADAGHNPLNDMLAGAGSGFIRSGLGAYGERLLGSSRAYVQNNVGKYFASTDFHYYFHVNDAYVRNKLKIIVFPFLHKGHWTRVAEQVAGGLTYKPPCNDINAPDLYIPAMAFATYVVLAGLSAGLLGRFAPAFVNARVGKGLIGWFLEVLLLRTILYSLASGDAPLLDLVAYAGYMFVGISLTSLSWVVWRMAYFPVLIWTSLCMAMFLVKTMKRVMFAETRHYDPLDDLNKSHDRLVIMADDEDEQLQRAFRMSLTSHPAADSSPRNPQTSSSGINSQSTGGLNTSPDHCRPSAKRSKSEDEGSDPGQAGGGGGGYSGGSYSGRVAARPETAEERERRIQREIRAAAAERRMAALGKPSAESVKFKSANIGSAVASSGSPAVPASSRPHSTSDRPDPHVDKAPTSASAPANPVPPCVHDVDMADQACDSLAAQTSGKASVEGKTGDVRVSGTRDASLGGKITEGSATEAGGSQSNLAVFEGSGIGGSGNARTAGGGEVGVGGEGWREAERRWEAEQGLAELPLDDAFRLFDMVFGRNPPAATLSQWSRQGFRFSDDPATSLGLVQREGGPCGVLAPVQALLLKYLLFPPMPAHPADSSPPSASAALAAGTAAGTGERNAGQQGGQQARKEGEGGWEEDDIRFYDSMPGLDVQAGEGEGEGSGDSAALPGLEAVRDGDGEGGEEEERGEAALIFSQVERRRALVLAMAESLWVPSRGQKVVIAALSPHRLAALAASASQQPLTSPISDATALQGAVRVRHLAGASHADVAKALHRLFPVFESDFGALLLLFSVLLSRGLERVQEDRDDPEPPLVTRPFGHASQEIVNLLLCGEAVANVFDGTMDLGGGMALKGIPSEAQVGFLTLLESLNLCKVGQRLKHPKLPIWVVGSESHYTVLFALSTEVQEENDAEAEESRVREVFDRFDTSGGGGFVAVESLQPMLAELRVNFPPETIDSLSALGVIVWNELWQALLKLDRSQGGFKREGSSGGRPASRKFDLYHFNGIAKRVQTVSSTATGAGVSGGNGAGNMSYGGLDVPQRVLSPPLTAVDQRPRLVRLHVTVPPKWSPEDLMMIPRPDGSGVEEIPAEVVADSFDSSVNPMQRASREAPLVDCIRTRWQRASCTWVGDAPSIV
ncbi:unnamed protein product [Closterium sp. Yama58-4]|nr:unnamed protein product [Closterium sp. Yama58-4]